MEEKRVRHYYEGDENTPQGWYLTAEEAARMVGLSKRWFYVKLKKKLTTYKLPGLNRDYYLESDVSKANLERIEEMQKQYWTKLHKQEGQ